ncbi:winged helix-turn-helix domain-containing protein [Thalassoglobus sp.]|uniref:winged helix-turn-helix domain-containing protein n=1 Tax=Thalassoglobus sp. TaxID=2795869 RepID=UPI003AA9BBBE
MAKKKATTKKATATSTNATTTKKTTVTEPKATTKPKPTAKKKLSMLDAAAKVLSKASEPMNSKALITAMAEQKLWTSPNGKTPHNTLYAALLREINTKGNDARFVKVDKGLFTLASK